jgi:hypothetical protein
MAGTMSAADALKKLLEQYNQTSSYVPKTADQIRQQAQGEYQSYYDQLRLAAQQAQARNDLALQQQREGLQRTYDKQREASQKEYENAYSRADRQQLSRGMQRSSYTAQVLANLTQEGAEAQQELWDAQGAAEGNIDAQRTQLAAQLADQLSQYSASEAADVLARIKQLEDQEYDRGRENDQYKNSLSAQIYQFLYQGEQDKIAQDQWQKEFDENVRQWNAQYGSKGSGGGGGNNYNTNKDTTGNGGNQYTDDTFLSDMSQDRAITKTSAGLPMPDLGLFPDRINSLGGINSVKSKLNEALKNKRKKKTSTNNGGGGGGRFSQAMVRD